MTPPTLSPADVDRLRELRELVDETLAAEQQLLHQAALAAFGRDDAVERMRIAELVATLCARIEDLPLGKLDILYAREAGIDPKKMKPAARRVIGLTDAGVFMFASKKSSNPRLN